MRTDLLAEAVDRQQRSAAERVAAGTQSRRKRVEALRQPGGLAKADEPTRIAARIDRLSHYYPWRLCSARRDQAV